MMLLLIAWRNIWRHKIRSLVVILSIAVGLWAAVFMMAFSWGMYRQYMKETVESQLSHIQIHGRGFEDNDREVKYHIKNDSDIMARLQNNPDISASCRRNISTGMVSSASSVAGVSIIGIDPAGENSVTKLASRVREGAWLDSKGKHPVLVGEKLARKLKIRLKSKIVLTCQDSSGDIVAGAFRVTGIYRSNNTAVDEVNLYVRAADLGKLINTGNRVHEIAIVMKNEDRLENTVRKLSLEFPQAECKTWKELAPELDLVINSFNEFMYIFVAIILLALTFGIVNTMLMAVMERVRELGMLMAIGMSRLRIFMMIMTETIFLALIGGPLGLFTGWLSIRWAGAYGIDLSRFSSGMEAYGFSSIIYPELESSYYLPITLMTVVTAILSAIYPAVRSIRLKPAEAIRKI